MYAVITMRLLLLLVPILLAAQSETMFEGRPAIALENDRILLVVTKTGATMNRLLLLDDTEKLNPIWEPIRMAREAGEERGGGTGGHFVCVDGFGPVSEAERAAGLPGHGEARGVEMEVVEASSSGGLITVRMKGELPIVREHFTRTYYLASGEQVVHVESELENLLGFDRPVVWAEHATIGAPFLSPEVTVVDLSAARSQVRPIPASRTRPHRLAPGADFTWPMAPAEDGGLVNVRAVPPRPDSLDHTTSLMDPNREYQFVTALHLEKRLLFGYVFRTEEFPWLQTWDNYPATLQLSRGIEFSTQPYDVPRREAISKGSMFETPTYRWLPAKSRIRSAFLVFYTRVPEGFRKVDDIRLENGQLIAEDRISNRSVTLQVTKGL